MRIKSKLNNNTSVMTKTAHVKIPAGAVLELDDAIYLTVEKQLKPLVDAGKLVILKGVAKTDEQVAADKEAALEAARKLIAEAEKTDTSVKADTTAKTPAKAK